MSPTIPQTPISVLSELLTDIRRLEGLSRAAEIRLLERQIELQEFCIARDLSARAAWEKDAAQLRAAAAQLRAAVQLCDLTAIGSAVPSPHRPIYEITDPALAKP
ncbi:MAG: hypothetical protein PHQ12_11415 [Chthoniobacteraceae bacterium]|nr:hypothetical protein [Chthoniobacteraceae bacterium]